MPWGMARIIKKRKIKAMPMKWNCTETIKKRIALDLHKSCEEGTSLTFNIPYAEEDSWEPLKLKGDPISQS